MPAFGSWSVLLTGTVMRRCDSIEGIADPVNGAVRRCAQQWTAGHDRSITESRSASSLADRSSDQTMWPQRNSVIASSLAGALVISAVGSARAHAQAQTAS